MKLSYKTVFIIIWVLYIEKTKLVLIDSQILVSGYRFSVDHLV